MLADVMMMAPSPLMVVRNSAITMPPTARPTASGMPAMIGQMIADELDVPFKAVEVFMGDTEVVYTIIFLPAIKF